MSNAIINQLEVVNTGRGRKTGKDTAKVRRSVVRIISNSEGVMTSNDVTKASKQKKTRVIAALRYLNQKGFIEKVGQQKVKEGRGRPSYVWKLNGDYKNIDVTQQKYVQEKREYVKAVSEMSYDERKELVTNSLNVLTALQTDDEVEVMDCVHTNGQGYIKVDSNRGVSDSQKEELTIKEVNYWITRIFKYRKQLNLSV